MFSEGLKYSRLNLYIWRVPGDRCRRTCETSERL